MDGNNAEEMIKVKAFVRNGEWDKQLLLSQHLEEMVDPIIGIIKSPRNDYSNDLPWWIGSTNFMF